MGCTPSDESLSFVGLSRRLWLAIAADKSPAVPLAAYRLARYRRHFQLSDLAGPSWDGFAIHGTSLVFPGLKYPLSVNDLRSTWISLQELRILRSNNALLRRDMEKMEQEAIATDEQAAYWRRQCRLEARAGMMLADLLPE